jgi:hypothetical protein
VAGVFTLGQQYGPVNCPSVRGFELDLLDAGGNAEAGLAFHGERLQRQRVAGAADQNVRA